MAFLTRRERTGWGLPVRTAVGLGLLFAWLLLVPLSGPVLLRSPVPSMAGLTPSELFLLAHALALLAIGVVGWLRPALWLSAPWAGAFITPLGLLLAVAPHAWWPGLLLAASAPASAAVLAIAGALARLPWEKRPWAIALGAALANVPLFLAVLLGEALAVRPLAAAGALGPLALPFLLSNSSVAPPRFSAGSSRPPFAILPGVFAAYLVGGLTYALILPTLTSVGTTIGVLPYIACCPMAAWAVNRWDRAWGTRLGLGTLGGGFLAWALSAGLPRELSGQGLVLAGYAFLDVSLWALFADHRGSPTASFGFGLAAMTMGIFAGMALSDRWAITTQGREAEAALVAAVALLAAAVLLPTQARGRSPDAYPEPLLSSPLSHERSRLSRREAEIVALAARALTNKEIARATGLSEGTVRKHLERAYRKLGVRSRVEVVALLRKDGSFDHDPSTDRRP